MSTQRFPRLLIVAAAVAGAAVVAVQSCAGPSSTADVGSIARDRSLTDADILAALKTYQPTGRMDEYLLLGSGGHSGQVLVIGVPSMRLLKVIGVFTPEPWQG